MVGVLEEIGDPILDEDGVMPVSSPRPTARLAAADANISCRQLASSSGSSGLEDYTNIA